MLKMKKIILLTFIIIVAINLQFSRTFLENMDEGFNLNQIAENIFVQAIYASIPNNPPECTYVGCPGGNVQCAIILLPNDIIFCYKYHHF